MRYEQINTNLFQINRKKLEIKLDPKGIALFCSNDVLPTNADGIMGFRQNNDLFYLTGIDQEDTYLLIFPDHPDENLREKLFI